ncbi:MAG: hypothetical protein AAB410_00835 [Patescibacteria group bacterium]
MKEFFKPNFWKAGLAFVFLAFVVYAIFFDSTNSKGAESDRFYLLLWPFIWPAYVVFWIWMAIEPGIADIPHRVDTVELLTALLVDFSYLYFLGCLVYWIKKKFFKEKAF